MEQKSVTRLKIRDVSKSFQNKSGKKELAIDHISFDVYDGEFLVLLGPGRCGKSVLLNVIAGLMEADDGKVVLDEEEVTGPILKWEWYSKNRPASMAHSDGQCLLWTETSWGRSKGLQGACAEIY